MSDAKQADDKLKQGMAEAGRKPAEAAGAGTGSSQPTGGQPAGGKGHAEPEKEIKEGMARAGSPKAGT